MASNDPSITSGTCENYCHTHPPPPYSSVPGIVPLYSSSSPSAPPNYDDVINPEGIVSHFSGCVTLN